MTEVLWTGFLFLIAGSIAFSLVLLHHWGYYGIKNNRKIFAKGLYFAGTVFFLFVVFVSLLLYQGTL